MNYNEHMERSAKFCAPLSKETNQIHLTLGIIGEEGEIAQVTTREEAIDEYGDQMWYIANLCRITGLVYKPYDIRPIHSKSACLGAVAEQFKKRLAYSKEINLKALERDLQSIIWWNEHRLRNVWEIEMDHVLDYNIDKLSKRYQAGKFSKEEAKAKKDKK